MGTVANNGGVSGISLQGVRTIKSAVSSYHQAIDRQAAIMLQTRNASSQRKAIKGDRTLSELDKFADAIVSDCKKYTNWLSTFENKLTEIENAYKKHDDTNSVFSTASKHI